MYHEKHQAEKDARIDTLTGLPNLRSYQETIVREIDRAKRTGHPLTLMMIDIDDFKKINDIEGHDVGDLVIKRLADIVGHKLRSSDTIARIGGEEFIIILSDTNLEDAKNVADKVVKAVESESGIPPAPKFTISGGYAQWSEKNENPHVLKEVADRALNEAKLKGINQMLPYEEGRTIEKSELIAQAVRHFRRGMPKALSKKEQGQVAESLLKEIDKETDE
ncbi:GGDEF domain-containing protein [Candidatus Peregrinibacteria bacterium]|nr:GGDEF domain-containing protein [Candidatus Peregrinibacteria bacterium]